MQMDSMTCQRYLDEFLAAHVDGELVGHDLRVADGHIDGCVRCRERFVDERRLKALIRTHSTVAKVPADVRLRIRAALGEAVEYESSRRAESRPSFAYRATRRGMRALIGNRSARIALPLAALGSLVFAAILLNTHYRPGTTLPEVPATHAFDLAVSKFDAFGRDFSPNAPVESERSRGDSNFAWVMDRDSGSTLADESAELARAYRTANVPEEVYNFEAAGYGLYGGRIDQSAEDGTVTYTLYRGEKGEILSVFLHAPDFSLPIGARYWVGPHTFYEYKDHSICLTFHPASHSVSMLVASEPVLDLLRDVTLADAASAAS
jgi:hypothetical protein